jgi:hypothetical protein
MPATTLKIIGLLMLLLLVGCNNTRHANNSAVAVSAITSQKPDGVLVTCRLPSQVRKLGSHFSYLAPERLTQTTLNDCEIRGGRLAMN